MPVAVPPAGKIARAVADHGVGGEHLAHRRNAIRHELRLVHQAGAESTLLHFVRRTAAVEVDLVVAPLRAVARGGGEVVRFAAAQLQRDGVFFVIKSQVSFTVAVYECASRYHFSVDTRMSRHESPKIAAMPVGPVHTRRGIEAPRAVDTVVHCIAHGCIVA